jgi:hypothetical protein
VEEGQVLFRVQGLTIQQLFTHEELSRPFSFLRIRLTEASVTLSTTSIAASH